MTKRSFWSVLAIALLALTLGMRAAPSASAAGYTITLVQIECLDKQDSAFNGRDEPYIEINGNRVWSGSSFTDGTSASSLGTFLIGSTANVRIWEEDSYPDADDLIGGLSVGSWEAGTGNKTTILTGSGGSYSLTYRINYN